MHRSLKLRGAALALCLSFIGPSANAQEDAVVGLVMATTGTYAFVGVSATNGAKLAAEEVNSAGLLGSKKLVLLTEDNASNATQAVTLINRLVRRDRALAVIGPVSTAEAMAVAPIAADLQVPLFTTGISTAITKISPWVFRSGQSAEQSFTPLAEYAAAKAGVKRCFVITIRDNDGYAAQSSSFIAGVKAKGAEIVDDERILSSDTDFAALATKISFKSPDCLFVSTPPEQGANIIIQARQAGLPASVAIFGNTGMSSPNFIRMGGQSIEGTYYPSQFVPSGVNETARTFITRYKERYGTDPDDWAAVGYSMVLVVANAIRNAGDNPTPASVRDAMAKTKDVAVPIGNGSFSVDAERNPQFGARVMQIKNGAPIEP